MKGAPRTMRGAPFVSFATLGVPQPHRRSTDGGRHPRPGFRSASEWIRSSALRPTYEPRPAQGWFISKGETREGGQPMPWVSFETSKLSTNDAQALEPMRGVLRRENAAPGNRKPDGAKAR